MTAVADIGVVGLAVMGSNLARTAITRNAECMVSHCVCGTCLRIVKGDTLVG